MPYVRDAIASLEAQTYRRLQVIVQDAVSTDGTAELLARARLRKLEFVSEPDSGIGDAFNRAFSRCSGDIVGSLDADNLLGPQALERAVELFEQETDAAAIYGAVKMIDEDGVEGEPFVPAAFDRHAVMRCELVPPFSTAFFSRRICEENLRCDASMKTCADYDLWLRLSHLPIVRTENVLGHTRLSDKSMTRDPSRYEQFCRDKLAALDRHVARRPDDAALRDQSAAGIYCWAAESLFSIEGAGDLFVEMVDRAERLDPGSTRVARARELAVS